MIKKADAKIDYMITVSGGIWKYGEQIAQTVRSFL